MKLAQERELVDAAKALTAKAKGKESSFVSSSSSSSTSLSSASSSALSPNQKKKSGQNGASSAPNSPSFLDSPGKEMGSPQASASVTERGGVSGNDNASLRQPSTVPNDSSAMLQNLTRLKATEKRSKEEKMWIALDALLNPDYYANHVSEQEVEEMTYDLDYQVVDGETFFFGDGRIIPTEVHVEVESLFILKTRSNLLFNYFTCYRFGSVTE